MGDSETYETGASLIRQLASCKQSMRDKALRQIFTSWLPSLSNQIPDDDMKKLWKGLFYCFWHADKLPYQTNLIHQLSSPLLSLNLSLSLQYLSVFLLTMRREWTGIDHLRLDKFYLFIRRFLHHVFALLKNNSWDLGLTKRVMAILEENAFLADDKYLGNGVNYHIASVFLEELRPFLPLKPELQDALLGPFVMFMGRVSDKVLLGKIKSGIFDTLLRMGRNLLEAKRQGEPVQTQDDAVLIGTIALTMGFSDKFYKLGSSEQCCQGNRKLIFGLHEEFLKLEKDVEASGIDISVPQVDNLDGGNDDNDDKMTNSDGPTDSEMEMEGNVKDAGNTPAGNLLKKLKKNKKASGESGKKSKKKKKKDNAGTDTSPTGMENVNAESDWNSNGEQATNRDKIAFNETVMSNLQMQFEKIAAEAGLENEVLGSSELPETTVSGAVRKKRKRTKSMDGSGSGNGDQNAQEDADTCATAKSGEKSVKKVRFSMKNNLVWKPHSPLPPQSLRIPPSVTPRGSALKKGVPAGPVREMPPPTKKVKRRVVAFRKGRKVIKSISPGTRRLKKSKQLSAQ